MRAAGLKVLLFLSVSLFMAGTFPGCDNPFDPLNSTDKIQGLAYFDFSATQEHWDSDPEWDGLQITMAYYNEFQTALSFHDKSHKVDVELWAKSCSGDPEVCVRGGLIASKTVNFSNSDDFIRIPIEYYSGSLPLPSTDVITGFVLIRIHPPQQSPQESMEFMVGEVELYKPEEAPI
jgi:hypothetical protein